MRMKNYTACAVVYLICMLAACILNLCISALAVRIVDMLIAPDFFGFAIVRAVSGIFTGCLVLGLVLGFEGYKSLEFSVLDVMIPVLLASVVHFLIAFLLRFFPFIAGGTQYLGGLLEQGRHFNRFESVADVRLVAYIGAFWIGKGVELIVAVIARWIGKRARLKNRETIKGYPYEKSEKI